MMPEASAPLTASEPSPPARPASPDNLQGYATMQDLIAALVSFFLIGPLQTKMADKLAAARACTSAGRTLRYLPIRAGLRGSGQYARVKPSSCIMLSPVM